MKEQNSLNGSLNVVLCKNNDPIVHSCRSLAMELLLIDVGVLGSTGDIQLRLFMVVEVNPDFFTLHLFFFFFCNY